MMSGHFYKVTAPEKLSPFFQGMADKPNFQKDDIVDFTHFDDKGKIMLGAVASTSPQAPKGKLFTTTQRGWIKTGAMGLEYLPDEQLITVRDAQKWSALGIGVAPTA